MTMQQLCDRCGVESCLQVRSPVLENAGLSGGGGARRARKTNVELRS
jgi:hypothetical protein